MAFIPKKRKAANAKIDANKAYTLKDASALVKEINTTKFDASVDLHIRLGVDPKKADQAIRGTVTLPHGTGKDVKVLGKQALGMFLVGTDSMQAGKYISEHDKKIANKLAYVMSGGDLSEASYVSEQYLLDLEREAFLSLTGERKTLERIEHMLKKGKPLRN